VLAMSIRAERSAGYFGKIPARGDFVASGLASPIVSAWDMIVSSAVAAGKAAMAERWSEVWLQAPVWRFALPPNLCGPAPLLGLWMPSIDKVGRYFPLMLATTWPGAGPSGSTLPRTLAVPRSPRILPPGN